MWKGRPPTRHGILYLVPVGLARLRDGFILVRAPVTLTGVGLGPGYAMHPCGCRNAAAGMIGPSLGSEQADRRARIAAGLLVCRQ